MWNMAIIYISMGANPMDQLISLLGTRDKSLVILFNVYMFFTHTLYNFDILNSCSVQSDIHYMDKSICLLHQQVSLL